MSPALKAINKQNFICIVVTQYLRFFQKKWYCIAIACKIICVK